MKSYVDKGNFFGKITGFERIISFSTQLKIRYHNPLNNVKNI